VRSGIEISNALRAICAAGETLSASLPPDDVLFLSRLLHVDPEACSIVIAWSTTKDANLAILAVHRVTFGCSHDGAHYEFLAFEPHESDHGGRPGIRFAFPEALLVLHRRAHKRYAVPPHVLLTCEITIGPISFDAKVVDISLNGIGAITYDAGIHLEAGMMLRRTRIVRPRELPLVVDLEVRHISNIVLPDGRAAHRAGCRLIGPAGEIESLVRNFVISLKKR
jgi:c-di-GMP-binding flagellar brake protein YcgR